MDFALQIVEGNLVIRLGGELDLLVAEEFRNKLEQALADYPDKNILLNLKQVSFIDSSGLGVILGRYRKINLLGTQMALIEMQPQVKKIMELSGLFKIMAHFDSEEDALNQLCTA